jgi:hypothetical protein
VRKQMNQPKPGKPAKREEPVEDPQILKEVFRLLLESEMEFPIKVEGTSTLPYTSRVQSLEDTNRVLTLKLVRPLPHELMQGAIFHMVFTVDEQRYEARITYLQREAYLQYRFSLPEYIFCNRSGLM